MDISKLPTDILREYKDKIQTMTAQETKNKFKDILVGYIIEKQEDYKSWATYEIQCELNYRAIRRHLGLSED